MTATTPIATERRRSHRRQPAQGTVCKLNSAAGEALGLGLVWNISQSGVSMLLGKAIDPGTELKGELVAADGHTSLGLGLKVAHLSKLETGDYFMGCQFDRQLSEQEIRPFVAEM
jgi:PilZ domain-containing protein